MDAAPLGDVARDFGISRDTLYRLVRRHGLQTYRRAGDRRTWVDRDEIRPLVALRPKNPRPVADSSHASPA
jgi:transposase-like protein